MTDRLLLLYRDGCGKCRFLSRVAVVLGMGRIYPVPLSSPLATRLTLGDHRLRGKLALIGRSGAVTGWRVLPAAVVSTLAHVWARRVER